MRLCTHFSSIGVPLRDFPSKSCADLRVEEVTFQYHKEHSKKLIPHLGPPKDSRLSLLGTSREHAMESCGAQSNHPPLLGHHPPMYQGREGDFEFIYKRPPRDEQRESTLLCWPKFPQAIQQCVIQSRDKGIQLLETQQLQSFGVERGNLRQDSLDVKTSLHWVLQLHSCKGPLASG